MHIITRWCPAAMSIVFLLAGCASSAGPTKPDAPPADAAASSDQPPSGIGRKDDGALLGPYASAGPFTVQGWKSSEANGSVNSWLLLSGDEAALIDAQLVLSEGERVVKMIRESGKSLKWIWITHGHPDHSTGLAPIVAAFPEAKVYAHPRVASNAAQLFDAYKGTLNRFFPGDIPAEATLPEAWEHEALSLGGHAIKVLAYEEGESEFTTALLVPSAKAVFAADMVYNRVFPWLNEMRVEGVRAHVDALEAIPDVTTFYPGHGEPVGKEYFATYREYLDLFERETAAASDANDLVRRVWSQRRDWRSLAGLRFSATAHLNARSAGSSSP
ncbi:MAG: MBL fold metallo-hydrolase [Myxococcota bacterium]